MTFDEPGEDSSGVPGGTSAESPDELAGASERKFWSELNIREWITAIATAAAASAAIASGVIAWWTYGQLDQQRAIMARQLKLMEDSAGDSGKALAAANRLATAAEANAVIGRGQLSTSQDTARRQLRPYLRIVFTGPSTLEIGQKPALGAEIANSGPSPAYEMTFLFGFRILPYPYHGIVDHLAKKSSIKTIPVVMSPGTSSSPRLLFAQPLTPDDSMKLKSGAEVRIYSWAIATYRDAYGQQHHSYACTNWRADSEGATAGEVCPATPDD
jgi:hypothetical protein